MTPRPSALPIEVEHVSHRYAGHPALSELNFQMAGGTTALLGVNGAGKSTLLRALAGAQQPTSGSIRIQGLNPYDRRERARALSAIALMPQLMSLPSSMTVNDVLRHVGWLRGLSASDAKRRAAVVAGQVGLAERVDARIKQISGGMLRRVALAQALIAEPEVLLLDEPSTGLDPEQRRAMVRLVRELDGAAVLFSSHVIEDVLDVAERVLILEGGTLVANCTLEDLLQCGASITPPASSDAEKAEAGFLAHVNKHRRAGQ